MNLAHPHQLAHQREPLDGGQGPVDVLGGNLAGLREAAAQRAGGFLVVQRGQRAGMPLIHNQTHGVRADIEHRHRTRTLDAALCGGVGVNAPVLVQSSLSSVSRCKALPRPDRLALVMK